MGFSYLYMKKITDIYRKYKIMPALAMHQIRVAAVAIEICKNIDITFDKESLVIACLLHDMGNIIKFNLKLFPEQNEPEGIDYWKQVKEEFISKYGKNEHIATAKIAEEIGVNSHVLDLIKFIDSDLIEKINLSDDISKKICMYADTRVTPYGITSFEYRMNEAKERYKDHPNAFDDKKHLNFKFNLKEIEKQIFSHLKIKPEDINDESVAQDIEKLKNYEF